ncbi:CehA/McbA family metallohydrolase [Massilia sp. AB1]|uniref:CehA/McbA family metallohydrolase n=1 Tax=Massilia sp. AB1 TaxID=2823371 RepID=UPI001B81A8E1|nr:CehA/McbA family metallohydrolase [Massilia sp. AB1]MBQ5940684.1 CehA/McbA family metallohydrolase [Massilia sp. AB1]
MKTSLISLSLSALLLSCGLATAAPAEHKEFEATLYAHFHAGAAQQRTFTLSFDYPGLDRPGIVDWRVELVRPGGRTALRWRGRATLAASSVSVAVPWSGRIGRSPAPPGIYQVKLHAVLRGDGHEAVSQDWEIAVGKPSQPRMPRFQPLPGATSSPAAAPAPGTLPYTVYLGNLHSQTKHSDGGAEVTACKGAQPPLSSPYGPDAAFAFAHKQGLDILLASEHNHMYDGSDGSAPDADAGKARALYQAGLASADAYTQAHPGFLALYGMEWGVINNGGHLNIFNSRELLGWETNARGELMADTRTPRGDYAALYTLMRERGWVGQFNHPAQTGQFMVNGVPLAYTPDGDEVMALCEVVNSTAFSTSLSESETRRSHFEAACNRLLEAGYHVAFSTNQDNHCANWGASYTNRTGILVPAGAALTRDSFIDALKARRVFATMDKGSQLVLSANGRMMGERFRNRGPLELVANFASSTGKQVAAVAIMEGVPGRKGQVTQLSDKATTSFIPAPGEHFYYARITQDDGKVLWSAPVWVTQE